MLRTQADVCPDKNHTGEVTPPVSGLHTVVARIDDYDGRVRWEAGPCPHGGAGDDRDCIYGIEEPDCLWAAWADGEHHPSCRGLRLLACAEVWGCPGDLLPACWEDVDEPDECDGFAGLDGHLHPEAGCYLPLALGDGPEVGWVWHDDADGTPICGPIPVRLGWDLDYDGLLVLRPAEVQP
jgi:hypothetical protein